MSDDIVFIKNENDYNEYNKLKPVKKYKRQKVKFICSCCNKESIKTFQYLKFPFKCKSCETGNAHRNYKSKNLDNIVFLHNINDYNAYSKLYPKYKYIFKKVRFTCTKCNQESVKTFNRLTEDMICEHCLRSASHLTNNFKETFKETNIKRYGTEYPMQSTDIREKYKHNNYKKYGVEFPMQVVDIKEKYKQTCLERYGFVSPMQLDAVKEKFKQTCKERYGVENPAYSKLIYKKFNCTINKKQKDKYAKVLTENKLKFLYRDIRKISYLQCLQCNNIFSLSSTAFLHHFKEENFNCPICSKGNNYSEEEKELLEYIKLIYDKQIIENDRNVLNGKELDIYLPDIRIGIEFDGTFWHADPRFYVENCLIGYRFAKDIWQRDKEKDILCESCGIRLIRIKEYDWRNNRDMVETELLNIIKTDI